MLEYNLFCQNNCVMHIKHNYKIYGIKVSFLKLL